jgi:maltooligosyltrehalose trehalohydrolase
MQQDDLGYWAVRADGIFPGDLYLFCLDGNKERPDPASSFQPRGVHKASQIIDHNTGDWDDSDWKGILLSEMILYELHVGTFTREGTFDAIISRIDHLKGIGINTIEIMPVAQYPGERNWGYDGVYPFAVQNSYGGPDSFKRLINECHKKNMAVMLDVVYNHLGPEGNYLWDYGPYFTDRYKTPWGQAVNFDGAYSNEVRNFFIENALSWLKNYHIDGLRIDAIHGMYDMSARPFLLELAESVEEFSQQEGRKIYLIAESDLNDSYAVRPKDAGGYGLDAAWCDDFHHALHTLLTGETDGYYVDFGEIGHLVKSMKEGFVYSGQYSAFRKRNHGNSSADIPADRFVVFSKNHDQIGNRMKGERLSSLVSFESLKLAAGVVLLSPYMPLIFMGEEYGETAPFLYFISHSDTELIKAIRQGRKHEFKTFDWNEEPPDPHDIETFMHSKLNWQLIEQKNHRILLELYRELIRLRKTVPALANLNKESLAVWADEKQKLLTVKRGKENSKTVALFNFSKTDARTGDLRNQKPLKKIFDSSDRKWKGPGTRLPETMAQDGSGVLNPESFALYLVEDSMNQGILAGDGV